jgi:hypothetical protein
MVNTKLWIPGNKVVIDESIVRFQGRANEKTTIPNKPTPTGFKVWVLAQEGFFYAWNWHKPGQQFGPIGVKTPGELGGSINGKGGNKTQAVLCHLLEKLPNHGHGFHCIADNLFTSHRLLEYLRSKGIGYTGTARTNSGIVQELVDLKKGDTGKNQMAWGTIHHFSTESNKVNQIGWEDSAFCLIQTTVFTGKEKTIVHRKKPRGNGAKYKRKWDEAFGNAREKDQEIPECNNFYNYNMNYVDLGDQYQSSRSGLRRFKRGGYQAIDQWILEVILTNCLLIARKSGATYRNQHVFRIQLFESLLELGKGAPGARKRTVPHSKGEFIQVPLDQHHLEKMPTKRDCAYCKGGTAMDRPPKRVALAQIAANQGRQSIRRTSTFGCKICNIALCKNSSCFDRYHNRITS